MSDAPVPDHVVPPADPHRETATASAPTAPESVTDIEPVADPASAEARSRGTVVLNREQLEAMRNMAPEPDPHQPTVTPATPSPSTILPGPDGASAEARSRGTVVMRPEDLAAAGLGGTVAAGSTGPPAGMYADPQHPGQQRYWDGERWAEALPPPVSPPVSPALGITAIPTPHSIPLYQPPPAKKAGFWKRLFGRD